MSSSVSSEKKAPSSEPLRSREPVWALRKPLPASWQLWLAFVLPVLLLILWVALTSGAKPVVSGGFLPKPSDVLRVLLRDLIIGKQEWVDGKPIVVRVLLDASIASSWRIVLSFFLAAAVALPLGILMGAFEPINRLVEPIMAPLRYMPISAFIPLTILWFGIEEKQKIAFLFLGVFVYLLPVVISAIRAVPEELVQTARTLGASRFQVIASVLVPAAAPDIFDSFRVMNAISWTYVILAEFVNTKRGLGYQIQLAGNHLHIDEVFAGIFIIGIIGLLSDALIRFGGRLLFPWREAGHV
ncbi:MAG TPA: ABC transporter permease [Pseudomonadota bacterium]|nr:ABC transporter permease [Pseudomonadota bacterium]